MNSKSLPIFLVAGLAVVGAVAWLVWPPGGESSDGPRVGGNAGSSVDRLLTSTNSPSVGDTSPPPVASVPFSEDDEPPLDPTLAAEMHFAIVVDVHGKPIAGADVELTAGGDRGPFGANGESRVLRASKSGPDGAILLTPLPRRSFVIEARTKDHYGFASYPPDREQDSTPAPKGFDVPVELLPIRRPLVTVQNLMRDPVPHIEVQLSEEVPEGEMGDRFGMGGRGDGGRTRRPTATTDDQGRATLEVTSRAGDLYSEPGVLVTAVLRGLDRVEVPLAWPAEGDAETTLQIPHTRALDLEIIDGKKALVSEATWVSWNLQPRDGNQNRDAFEAMFRQSGRGNRLVTGGKTTIGGFAPDATIHFETRSDSRLATNTTVAIPALPPEGPVQLSVGEIPPEVSFTLLDPQGRPLAKELFSVSIQGTPDPTSRRGFTMITSTQTSDHTGRFTLRAPIGKEGTLRVATPSGMGRERGPMPGGGQGSPSTLLEAKVPALTPESKHDLGDLKLPADALGVSGRVVFADGKPAVGAQIEVTPVAADAEAPAANGRRMGRGPSGSYSAIADGEGKFRLFARSDSNRFRLVASSRGASSDEVEATAGTTGLELRVIRHGEIRGTVQWGNQLPGPSIEVIARLTSDPNPEARPNEARARPRGDGAYRLRDLKAGTYTLEARVQGQTAASIPGVIVSPDGQTTPPQEPWIIGQDWTLAEIEVRDELSLPVVGARIRIIFEGTAPQNGRGGRGGPRESGLSTDKAGVAKSWLHHHGTFTVQVSKDNFETSRIENPAFPLRLTLRAARETIVRLPAPLPADPEGRAYRVMVVGSDQSLDIGALFRGGNRGTRASVEAGASEIKLLGIAPGRHQLMLMRMPVFPAPGHGGGAGQGGGRGGRNGFGRNNFPNFSRSLLGEIEIPAQWDGGTIALGIDAATFQSRLATEL